MSTTGSMGDYGISSAGLDKAVQALEGTRFNRLAGRVISPALRKSANLIRRKTRAELLRGHKSRRMRDHIRVRFTGWGMGTEAGVKSTGAPSNLIVGGVRPHRIAVGKVMPMWSGRGAFLTKKGNLRQGGAGAGVTGFARAVEHPGLKADPFFHRGIEASVAEVNTLLQEAADGVAAGLKTAMEGR